MEIVCGPPPKGAALAELKAFLAGVGLTYDDRIDFLVQVFEDDVLVGTGSLDGPVLKCIAVSPLSQSAGTAARIVTELIVHAAAQGLHHLFLFTKPVYKDLFSSLGFYALAQTNQALLMENKKDGLARFLESLRKPPEDAAPPGDGPPVTGAVVAHCNPLTRGHLYLFETAARQCRWLHVFILSEERGEFPQEVRRNLVIRGAAHIPNLIVQPTGPYIVSGATFPDYFLKKDAAPDANGRLDLTLFATRLAPPLGITRRFVGTEPYSPITARYNALMKEILPEYGIGVTELPRLEEGGEPVSASRVRALLAAGRLDAVRPLVPDVTWEYLQGMKA